MMISMSKLEEVNLTDEIIDTYFNSIKNLQIKISDIKKKKLFSNPNLNENFNTKKI